MKEDSYYKYNPEFKNCNGFTLIELMVAVSVFVVVMFISGGAILRVLDANQKSKTLRSVMDNLNVTLESMTRTIRFGTNYHCGPIAVPPQPPPLDCSGGSNALTVRDVYTGLPVTYSLSGGCIARSINGAANQCLTSPDVNITNMTFRVSGSAPYPDLFQPLVVIVIGGTVTGSKPGTQSSFSLETTASQRNFDLQ